MNPQSIKLSEDDRQSLERVAAGVGALYSGAPSWRRLVLWIARGKVVCKKVQAAKTVAGAGRKAPRGQHGRAKQKQSRAKRANEKVSDGLTPRSTTGKTL